MTPTRLAVALLVAAAACGWTTLAGADQPVGTAASYPVAAAAMPAGITAGPDGNLWFVEPHADQIGRITPSGALSEHLILDPPMSPVAITAGVAGTASAGLLWFTDTNVDIGGLAAVDPGGSITPKLLRIGHAPGGIAADSVGNLWIAFPSGNAVEEVKPPYTSLTPTRSLPSGADPRWIARGPDGQTMWFTEPGVDAIASVAQDGTVTQHPVSGVTGTLGQIVLGPDGNLWTGSRGSGSNPSAVVRITAGGTISVFDLPSASSANPDVIAVGPDHELWLAGGGGLTSVTTAGGFTDHPGILPSGDAISSLASDPGAADALWVTDQTTSSVDRVSLQPPPPPPPPPPPVPTPPPVPAPPAPPSLTAAIAPILALLPSGATLSGLISEPLGSPATAVSYFFQYGTSLAYGAETALASTTATASGVTVNAVLGGLSPFTTYHYRLVASDCAAPSCQTVTPDQSFTTGSTLQPAPNTTVGVTTTGGTILVKLQGQAGFTRLSAGELIPLGSTVDARHGTVLIQSATGAPGHLASGLFGGGVFVLTQPAGGTVTVLALSSNFASCGVATLKATAHAAAAAASNKKKKPSKKRVSHKTVNEVFGNAHGQFSTRGHYATAADQGTKWRTADRCDGTLVSVSVGKVVVSDFLRHRTVVVKAGHSYLARTH
jgi:streptogramin lyase